MKCSCKDKNNLPLPQCLGICAEALERQRTYKIISYIGDSMTDVLDEFKSKITLIEKEIKDSMRRISEKSFEEGIKKGHAIGFILGRDTND